jgi:hypothetical protein
MVKATSRHHNVLQPHKPPQGKRPKEAKRLKIGPSAEYAEDNLQ